MGIRPLIVIVPYSVAHYTNHGEKNIKNPNKLLSHRRLEVFRRT